MVAFYTSWSARNQKLKRAIARARVSNPVDLAVLSSLPTVTNTFDAALTTSFLIDDVVNSGTKYANLLGGTPHDVGAVNGGIHGWSTAPFALSGTDQQKQTVLEFYSDAPKILIRGQQGTWRTEVNGQFISKTGNATVAAGGEQQLAFDWSASRATRLYRIHVPTTNWFSRFFVDALSRVWAPSKDDEVRVVIIGDSIPDGTGATYADNNCADVAAALLGFNDPWHFTAGGTGYLNAGAVNTFRARAATVIASNPDVALIISSGNDTPGASLTAEVLLLLQTLRAGLATTPIIVCGVPGGNTGPSGTITSIESNVSSAVTSFADPLCKFVALSSDATGAWIFGTGKVGSTNGSGNSDVYIGSDGTHPVDVGHEYLGRRIAVGVRNALLSMLA